MFQQSGWALVLALLAAPLAAQQRTIVTGIITDSAGVPLAGVEVFLGSAQTPAVTNDRGIYMVTDAHRGRLWISARRIGYAPTRRSATIERGRTTTLDLGMAALPVLLDELVVLASGMHLDRLSDFWRRSRMGWGRFLTRDDIERRRPTELGQLVRMYLPGGVYRSSEQETFDPFNPGMSASSRFSHPRCAPALSLNGGYPQEGWHVNDLAVQDIEALEVYRPGMLGLPFEYSTHPRASRCGMVVAWLRG
jgi:hypothetical protein